jgi:hypothetical protein
MTIKLAISIISREPIQWIEYIYENYKKYIHFEFIIIVNTTPDIHKDIEKYTSNNSIDNIILSEPFDKHYSGDFLKGHMNNIDAAKHMDIEYVTLFSTNCYLYQHLYDIAEFKYTNDTYFDLEQPTNIQYKKYKCKQGLSHFGLNIINSEIVLQNTCYESLLGKINNNYSTFNKFILNDKSKEFVYGPVETFTSKMCYFRELLTFYLNEQFFDHTYYISTLFSLEEIFPHTFMKNNNYEYFFLGWRTSRDYFISDCNIIKHTKPEYFSVFKIPCRNKDIIEKTIDSLSSDNFYNNHELARHLTY